MNKVVEEMNDILMHYGMPRRSGRYPYGSGDDPYQHSGDFLSRIETLKKSGWTESAENIKKEFGMTTTQYRAQKSNATNERRMLNVATAKAMRADGKGDSEIGRALGVNESTVRSWFNGESEVRMNKARETANFLKKQVDEKGMIDVGTGVELELNISKEKMKQALTMIEEEGYPVYSGRNEQVTNKGKWTTLKVACPPGTEYKDIYSAFENGEVHSIKEYISHDGGETFDKFVYPKSMDSKRLMIRYKDDAGPDGVTGIEKDGVIELRRGVKDLSLGDSHYAQVRIMVDNDRYLKGMAVYSDDMPPGVDVVFNTNKSKDVPMRDVLKTVKNDPDNPFGSLIKKGGQSYYIDENGERQLSLINKRADEGDWTEWKDTLPSQFLSKQSLPLAKKQINMAITDKMDEYDEICSLTNPTVKKKLLETFANDCDSTAVHLKAAALPGQKYHVIMPVNALKETEVYAPGYESGTKLALVRYPHGGTFEIPILSVNNKNQVARKLIGTDSVDVVCINSKVAERLSGADFDGDTVMCIPTHDKSGKVKITSTRALKGLEGFDPKTEYGTIKKDDGYYNSSGNKIQVMTKKGTQLEMGRISNLITDMTLQGADVDELARAVRHSMVVIDAEKHKLDYKTSESDNAISSLKKKYQKHADEDGNEKYGGASTLISRSKSEVSVDKRQGSPRVNIKGKEWYDPSRPEGALIYKPADDLEYTVTKVNKRTGEVTTTTKKRKQQSTRMAETDDAYTLVSDANTPMERLYADYANKMKALANTARKEMVNTGKIKHNPRAKEIYSDEVESLNRKLKDSLLNAPRERQAQLKATAVVNAKRQSNPGMDASDLKKAKQQALTQARASVGAKRKNIEITSREWEAIQAGAVSENVLSKILNNTDSTAIRQLATPRSSTTLNASKISRIKSMSASNYTLNEIANKLGVSTSVVSKYLKGAD